MGALRIGLFDPGMTTLHRVGLAGLWMTLDALEREEPETVVALQKAGGRWQLERTGIELSWREAGGDFFKRLFEVSFRLTQDGRIWLTGVGHPDRSGDLGVTLQDALLGSYLQHGKHRRADPPNKPRGALALTIDETQVPVRYRRVSRYQHQVAGKDFRPDRPLPVKGWLFPGGAVRHSGYETATALTEPPGRWLALLYAPVATVYFWVRRPGTAIRPSVCLVLVEVDDLSTLATLRRELFRWPVKELMVSGAADAALRILGVREAEHVREALESARCQVITFGKVGWVQAQQVRVDVFDAAQLPLRARQQYALLHHALPALPPEPRSSEQRGHPTRRGATAAAETPGNDVIRRYLVSPVPDLAARNLVGARPWWADVARLLGNRSLRQEFERHGAVLRQQQGPKGGLAAVVRNSLAFNDLGAETIVRACHEAWRRRLGQLGEEAKRGRSTFATLVERERVRWWVALANCRNLATLRTALTNIWARAGGPIPVLQQNWREILPYLTEARWQEARDLALLALVSYAGEESLEHTDAGSDTPPAGKEAGS